MVWALTSGRPYGPKWITTEHVSTITVKNVFKKVNKTMVPIEFKEDDLHMLRAVLACAGVDDTRDYLNGIHVTNQYVESTDGHRFARFKTPAMWNGLLSEKGVILPNFKIPKSVQNVVFVVHDDRTEIHLTDTKGHIISQEVPHIDGSFPDLDQVTPHPNASDTTSDIVLNPHLIAEVTKTLGRRNYCPVEIYATSGHFKPYHIKIFEFPNLIFYVMPVNKRAYEE